MDEQSIIPAVVADRYEQYMSIFEEKGRMAVASTMEMWNAVLEIYVGKLWRARFNTVEEWIGYISELGYTGLSRSNIFGKLSDMKNLINQGVQQEIAAAAVTSVPGAIRLLRSVTEFRSASKEADPTAYVSELMYLSPGEAIKRVRQDKGNLVGMWVSSVIHGRADGEIVGVIVREDGQRGYTAYDVKVQIEPQIPGNRDLVHPVASWLINRMAGRDDNSRVR